MLTTSRRRTELMVRTAYFKVKVIWSQMLCALFRVRPVTLKSIEGFRRNLAHVLTTSSRRAELNCQTTYHKVIAKGSNPYDKDTFGRILLRIATSVLACKHLT